MICDAVPQYARDIVINQQNMVSCPILDIASTRVQQLLDAGVCNREDDNIFQVILEYE